MNHFYILETEEGIIFGTKWAYAEIMPPDNSGVCEYCPVCHSPVSSLAWLPPHKIKLTSAKPEKWGDFVWGAGFPLLVSERFKQIYEKEQLSGFGDLSEPVEVVKVGPSRSGDFPYPPPRYYLASVHWGGANQDDAASEVRYEQPQKITCSYCRTGVAGLSQPRIVIEEGSWNGDDIFKARNAPQRFMVSERFKEIAEKNQLLNMWLIPAERYGYDEPHCRLGYYH